MTNEIYFVAGILRYMRNIFQISPARNRKFSVLKWSMIGIYIINR